MFEKPQAERVLLSSLPSCLKNPLLLSQLHQQEPRAALQARAMPQPGSVPFFCRAKVPDICSGVSQEPAQPWAKASLAWVAWQGQPSSAADTRPAPHTAGLDVCATTKHRRKPSCAQTLVIVHGSRRRTRRSLGARFWAGKQNNWGHPHLPCSAFGALEESCLPSGCG